MSDDWIVPSRYELRLNGVKQGSFDVWSEVWDEIQRAFLALPDQYGGEIYIELEDFCNPHEGVPAAVWRCKFGAALWYACAENPRAFASYLAIGDGHRWSN